MIDPRPARSATRTQAHVMHQVEVMGTVVVIDVYADVDTPTFELSRLVEEAAQSLHQADEVFSTWIPTSPMSRLRRDEIGIGEVPPEITQVLGLCSVAKELSHGWFDPWALPGGVDPTGYVKGWAAQRALGALVEPPVTGAIINAAGDIASFGGLLDAHGGQGFRFGIVDPFARRQILCVVTGTDALATSGTYERGPHLIDPRTGARTTAVASASVSGPDLGVADALATALAVAGDEGLAIIAGIENYEGMILTQHGVMRRTVGFPIASS
jgi:thiamine biosynthesis lipoprotein